MIEQLHNPLIFFLTLLAIHAIYFYILEYFVQITFGKIKAFRLVLYIVSFFAGYYMYVAGVPYFLVGLTVLLPRVAYTMSFVFYYLKRLAWVFLASKGFFGMRSKDIAEFAIENQESVEFASHIRNETIDREHMQEYYENEEWK